MKTLTIKQLYNIIGSPFVFDTTITYPTIEGNTSNFISDYETNKESLDWFFIHEYGKRVLDVESESDADIAAEVKAEFKSILLIYLDNWARLYYALNEPYNPLFNVDGTTTYVYGEHVTDHDIASRTNSHTEGAKSRTRGTRTDNSTTYAVSYDATTEKETGKQTDELGSSTDTEQTYTNNDVVGGGKDTDTSKTHTDTETRQGNIGVTKSTELLRDEIKLRTDFAFFKTLFQTIIEEVGAYYEYNYLS